MDKIDLDHLRKQGDGHEETREKWYIIAVSLRLTLCLIPCLKLYRQWQLQRLEVDQIPSRYTRLQLQD